jgi:hypothetical protein
MLSLLVSVCRSSGYYSGAEEEVNSTLMEELLNEEEGPTLDFKRDQYPFAKATDLQKCELLKDILAFANAWRRTDAYVLIGVEEVRGGRSNAVGINTHLDDAKLQQFVNSKTNRPVVFSYETFSFEGVYIGVISLPLQDRPIYLAKDFGRLRAHDVYIRRGSSTDVANPDEVAKMGSIRLLGVKEGLVERPTLNPVVEALRREQEQDAVVLVERVIHRFDSQRLTCRILEVNELYVTFRQVPAGQDISGAISQITASYEPTMKMKLFIIAPIA